MHNGQDCDIIYFCNPNNPTGACATRAQLESLVKLCVDNKILLIYGVTLCPCVPHLPSLHALSLHPLSLSADDVE